MPLYFTTLACLPVGLVMTFKRGTRVKIGRKTPLEPAEIEIGTGKPSPWCGLSYNPTNTNLRLLRSGFTSGQVAGDAPKFLSKLDHDARLREERLESPSNSTTTTSLSRSSRKAAAQTTPLSAGATGAAGERTRAQYACAMAGGRRERARFDERQGETWTDTPDRGGGGLPHPLPLDRSVTTSRRGSPSASAT